MASSNLIITFCVGIVNECPRKHSLISSQTSMQKNVPFAVFKQKCITYQLVVASPIERKLTPVLLYWCDEERSFERFALATDK